MATTNNNNWIFSLPTLYGRWKPIFLVKCNNIWRLKRSNCNNFCKCLCVNNETGRDAPAKAQHGPLLLAQMSKHSVIRKLCYTFRQLFCRLEAISYRHTSPLLYWLTGVTAVSNVFKKLEAVWHEGVFSPFTPMFPRLIFFWKMSFTAPTAPASVLFFWFSGRHNRTFLLITRCPTRVKVTCSLTNLRISGRWQGN